MRSTDGGDKKHLLTINLEDYFQVGTLRSVIRPRHWYRFENRVEANTRKTLDLLDEHGAKATFFALGWIADELPEIIREVVSRGHEVASKGYYHRSIGEMSPAEFREDILRSKEAIERASGTRVQGYRIARGWFSPDDLWALDILAEEGFAYDSSLRPFLRSLARNRGHRGVHIHYAGDKQIWEFPLSTWTFLGFSFPISGGNYLRQLPTWLMKRAARNWDRTSETPFVMYFHVWELDPGQPRVKAAPFLQQVRQYRNLNKMPSVIADYLRCYRFTGLGHYLGLSGLQPPSDFVPEAGGARCWTQLPVSESPPRDRSISSGTDSGVDRSPRTPVSVVIPCYNEDLSLPYLSNTLQSVSALLDEDYDLRFVFVDDCSRDKTWETLNEVFGDRKDCHLLRHKENRGVAAAILTGIRESETEVVCSMDCDCTYDPHEFVHMIPLLEDGVDLVTASPYHPKGKVLNVPGWRLFLSKGLSALYRLVLHQKLATYTSCFRVYRRSAIADIDIREGGFLGVAELVAKLDLRGSRVVEYPAVLEVRLLGESKMKVLRTIVGHLKLFSRVAAARFLKADHHSPTTSLKTRTIDIEQAEENPRAGSPKNPVLCGPNRKEI